MLKSPHSDVKNAVGRPAGVGGMFMAILESPCQWCGATVVRDNRRKRYMDADGATHQCAYIPVVADVGIRECSCGVLVTLLPDDRTYDFHLGTRHICGVVTKRQVPIIRPVVARNVQRPKSDTKGLPI